MKKSGFTLIELMIAVAITSIVVIAGYALLNGTTSTFSDEENLTELRANLRNAEMLLQRDIGRIGFRSGFFKNAGDTNSINPDSNSDVKFQALRIFRDTTNNFSEMTLVGDLTDFGYFYVQRQSGTTIIVDPTTSSRIQNNDCLEQVDSTHPNLMCGIGFCQGCKTGAAEPNSTAVFQEAFESAFTNAAAARFVASSSSIEKGVVKSITNVVNSSHQFSVASSTFPADQDFAALLIGDKVSPVYAVTYKVVAHNNSTTDFDLIRCMHDLNFTNPKVNSCSIILRNVVSFDIFPMDISKTSQQFANDIANNNFDNVALNHLGGVAFRVAIRSEKPVKTFEYQAGVDYTQSKNLVAVGNTLYHRATIMGNMVISTQPSHEELAATPYTNATSALPISYNASNSGG